MRVPRYGDRNQSFQCGFRLQGTLQTLINSCLFQSSSLDKQYYECCCRNEKKVREGVKYCVNHKAKFITSQALLAPASHLREGVCLFFSLGFFPDIPAASCEESSPNFSPALRACHIPYLFLLLHRAFLWGSSSLPSAALWAAAFHPFPLLLCWGRFSVHPLVCRTDASLWEQAPYFPARGREEERANSWGLLHVLPLRQRPVTPGGRLAECAACLVSKLPLPRGKNKYIYTYTVALSLGFVPQSQEELWTPEPARSRWCWQCAVTPCIFSVCKGLLLVLKSQRLQN